MLCNQTCAFKVRNSGAEKTNTSLSLNYRLSLQNNKQSWETHLQQDLSWLMTAHLTGGPRPSWGDFIYVGCFGFILYILGLENARNLLAEQVYPFCFLTWLFSTEVCVYKNSLSWLCCQWDSLNLKQILSENAVCYVETESGSDFEIEVSELTTKMYGKI